MNGDNQKLHSTIQSVLFPGGLRASLSQDDEIRTWLEGVLSTVYQPPNCGDGLCLGPEEYPSFQAHPEARSFSGCRTDCGQAKTTPVTIDFFDPWKLQTAYQSVEAARTGGWNYGDGMLSAEEYDALDRTPAAGWNVCSRNLNEYGFFEHVCLFDGDVSIDGLPYRTAELDINSDKFAGGCC